MSDAAGSYKIFVGRADVDNTTTNSVCSTASTAEPCNSCALMTTMPPVATGQTVCNVNSIHPNLYFVVTIRSDKTDSFPAGAKIVMSKGTDIIATVATSPDPITVNTDIAATFKWADICDKLKSDSECKTSFQETVLVGVAANSSTAPTDYVTLQINYRVANDAISTAFHSNCNSVTPTAANQNEGGCSFDIFPGDEKVYVDVGVPSSADGSSGGTSTWPSPGSSVMSYSGVRIFYRESPTQAGNLTAADWAMAPGDGVTQYQDIPIAADGSITNAKVTGLSNDVRYVFMMATYDQAGNITNFSDVNSAEFINAALVGYHEGTPTEVVGLLDSKKCFIATATFGSPMAAQVSLLRKFRDEFMLTNSFGRSLAQFYYSVSPDLANKVHNSKILKTMSLVVLWPVVKSIELGYQIGFIPTILILLIFGFCLRELSRRILPRLRWR